MDEPRKMYPCTNYEQGQDDLSNCEYIRGRTVFLYPIRVGCNYNSVNGTGVGGDGCEDRDDENKALMLLNLIA